MADDALAHMPYADAVLNEVLRMHSVVDGVWRRALEDLTIQGHHVPEVSAIAPCSSIKTSGPQGPHKFRGSCSCLVCSAALQR